MEVSELKNICDERGIKRIAMVDDVFDVPDKDYLDRNEYHKFQERYNSDQKLKRTVTWVSGMNAPELPHFDDLSEEALSPLWRSLWKSRINGRKLNKEHFSALKNLFQNHGHDVLGMLDTVVELLSLFRDHLGKSVTVHGTDFEADEVAKAEIVLVDYFLGQGFDKKEEYLRKSSQVVKDVVAVARSKNRAIPSFLLVSSRPQEIDIEEFRNCAELMKSRFRFFPKESLNTFRVEDMISLHDLIDASNHTEKIERLIEDWWKGANESANSVREQMLRLDVSDFVYLDCFRLMPEGTSIANYLRWFLTALLNAEITSKLRKSLWQDADTLKLFSLVDESGYLDQTTLVKTFDGPSDIIAYSYVNILFDKTRGAGNYAFPKQLPGYDLVEGDLFVCPKSRKKKSYENTEVRLVMTPSCDLIPRVGNKEPSAKSVLLLPGILNKVNHQDKESNFVKDFFVRVPVDDEEQFFRIKWDFNNPISIDWSEMCKEGPGKNFKRLGRVRDFYFHKIKEKFTNHFTRIGINPAPLLPHPRSGEVFIKNGRKNFKSVMKFSSKDLFVWQIGPVQVVTTPKKKPENKDLYQASRHFLDRLTNTLKEVAQSEDANLVLSANCSLNHLKNMQTCIDILKPMLPGVRGDGKVIEFKKAIRNSELDTNNLRSRANLLVVTFFD